MFVLDQTYIHTNDCLSLAVPGSGLSPGAVAGIVVVLLAAAVGVAGFVYYCRKNSEPESQSGKYHTQFM